MDSFFSLFDPSEGHNRQRKVTKPDQDNVRKKPEGSKGRRRGRRSHVKNETLPEESSFLCEPDLSTEMLVKDGSYIESYIEVNMKEEVEDKMTDEDTNTEMDKKPRRRNSRRGRRRKNKVSPPKDVVATSAWNDTEVINTTSWNNQSMIPKICDENIGKNVNNLRVNNTGLCNTNTKADSFGTKNVIFQERSAYNVIDKLEKVSLKDDMYLAGDFNTEDLDNDCFYSSDDLEEPFEDTTSEPEDSSEEVYGSLPPEPRFGNVEYKLQLVSVCERRFQHLVTQLKWRLRSGGGSAVYVVGVRDCGALCGLRARALRGSLSTLRRMATALSATLTHVTMRRVAPHRAVAEVYIRKLADTQQSVELRVAVMGANEAGKSTLIGVLTQGELDNGRGSARLNMFRHLHEVKSGRTSSVSHEILGFDAQGNVVNYGCSELMTAERIGERSAKLVSFLDLAGHSKYQRTTLHGLTGYSPHYAMLVISATAGITRITEEHIGLLLALDLPFFTVISKCELAAASVQPLIQRLTVILASANKRPLLITDESLARSCVAPQKLILDTIDSGHRHTDTVDDDLGVSEIPVFPVSCVRGAGLNVLHAYLLALHPPVLPPAQQPDHDSCEFQIDEIFNVGDPSGPVVGGLLARGQLHEGDHLIIGPLDTGEFVEISVKSIYRNRVPCGVVKAGQSASLGLSHRPPALRAGMVLLAIPPKYKSNDYVKPTFGGCPPGKCKRNNEIAERLQIRQQSIHLNENSKNRKNVRRKNKNLFEDIESGLVKNIDNIDGGNIYKSDSDGENVGKIEDQCTCCDEILLEDPNDPRGCLFFQASVEVLRHSTAISSGFQCTVHVGNVRQTAIIEGIMSRDSQLRAGEVGSVMFRFARCPEYLVRDRRLLFTAGLGTRAIGRVTQIFPYVP